MRTNKARVMVVDDSVVIRKLLTDLLAEDPAIEIVGVANNGKVALAKLPQLKPDLVTLDIEMPEMDGLETLRRIRRDYPRLPVIMFSSLTEKGASATLDALTIGASDYVTKPANVGSVTQGMQAIREQLVPKVKALCKIAGPSDFSAGAGAMARPSTTNHPSARLGRPSLAGSSLAGAVPSPARAVTLNGTSNGTSNAAPNPAAGATTFGARAASVAPTSAPDAARPARNDLGAGLGARPVRAANQRVDALVIGASTGGPNALAAVFAQLGPALPVPVFVAQHMPPLFTSLLAERLGRQSGLPTVEATDGVPVAAGTCLLAPGDYHMVIERVAGRERARLNQDAPEQSCRPAVDPLFRSAARVYGAGVLAVVLTGMGADGANGAAAIRAAGGQVVVQDEATSVVWGMPGKVATSGLADAILPLDRIAAEISQRLQVGRSVGATR